jgi:tRNA(Ile)-lysidine synthase
MLNQFLQFIKKHALILEGEKLLLAVSGGLDSMVLLELCRQAKFNIKVAHCNFGLRSIESDGDAEFVKRKTSQFGLEYFERKFDTKGYANSHGISTQMAARDLRYKWFEDLIVENKLDKLLVAQHLDDNIETVLLNLFRGTSISGLRGMRTISGRTIRPLLNFKKIEIENFAKENEVEWREDSSNAIDDYKRNFVRHNLVPLLPKLNEGFHDTFKRTLAKNAEVEQVFDLRIADLQSLLKRDGELIKIDKSELVELNVGAFQLSMLLTDFGFNYDQCLDIMNSLSALVGSEFLTKSHVLIIDRESLIIEPKLEGLFSPLSIDRVNQTYPLNHCQYDFSFHSGSLKIINDPEMGFIDASKLVFPLQIRSIREGDSFCPLGMKGRKKLSDFMIDEKIPLNLKRKMLVLTSGRDIVWIVGHRLDDRYKITKSTEHFLQIKPSRSNV